MDNSPQHIPVLTNEVLLQLKPQAGDVLLDGTLGLGGHTAAYLKLVPSSRVIGFDADAKALQQAQKNLENFAGRVTFINDNFWRMDRAIRNSPAANLNINHVLLDLGVGSHQLSDEQRGFSFRSQGPLKMAYGRLSDLPDSKIEAINLLTKQLGYYPDADDLIIGLSSHDLTWLIRQYGEEKYAGRIAAALKANASFLSAGKAAEIISKSVPAGYERGRIHPATRTFQSLRLAVNRELEALEQALPQAVEILSGGGKLAIISFHSLEDRIVKNFLRRESKDCICDPKQPVCTCGHKATLKILTKKPVRPTEEEAKANPRSRSAKLRVAQKLKT